VAGCWNGATGTRKESALWRARRVVVRMVIDRIVLSYWREAANWQFLAIADLVSLSSVPQLQWSDVSCSVVAFHGACESVGISTFPG